ncbi:MAG TPA: hypothetical protein VJN93_06750 [Candidatus Acidoferrum sp.]|nr:hypothetical protein [Candidatus Acidoferrum sp.]
MAVPEMRGSQHGAVLAVLKNRNWIYVAALLAAFCAAVVVPARADEIRLKDGKKLYGVIVAYEDNMFKVKTDFGYVLVEKDKIASIIPTAPASDTAKTEKVPAAKHDKAGDVKPKAEEEVASARKGTPEATNASEKTIEPAPGKSEKAAAKITNEAVRPNAPAGNRTSAVAPAINGQPGAQGAAVMAAAAQPAAPKEPEPPAIRETIQGNLYTNYTHGFRMYKAPSWDEIEDARQALPNAIVALGTEDESTLMVIGQEKTKEPLEQAAATVESRMREVYENYRGISRRKTIVGGFPAVEFKYTGTADTHDWSGTLAVIERNGEIFTVLGMTYADTDLIQIQENVIARAIASLDFNVH